MSLSLQRMAEKILRSAPPPQVEERLHYLCFSSWGPSVVGCDDAEPQNAQDKDRHPKPGTDCDPRQN